ncbi:hypothetical protein EVAR_64066_1 [Eumeta japonica]|uniref:Uncharacterized protein n=1 Tax=Eumeta variegata TaxID=151549 RepID=A0A4C1ZA08_EUMVA|nr:hypothetical protein EVAR_64066_1 [Eumeta japonica]
MQNGQKRRPEKQRIKRSSGGDNDRQYCTALLPNIISATEINKKHHYRTGKREGKCFGSEAQKRSPKPAQPGAGGRGRRSAGGPGRAAAVWRRVNAHFGGRRP